MTYGRVLQLFFFNLSSIISQILSGTYISEVLLNYLTDPVNPCGHICLTVSGKVVDSLWGLDVKHELVGHSARLVGQPSVHLQWNYDDDDYDDYDDDGDEKE